MTYEYFFVKAHNAVMMIEAQNKTKQLYNTGTNQK